MKTQELKLQLDVNAAGEVKAELETCHCRSLELSLELGLELGLELSTGLHLVVAPRRVDPHWKRRLGELAGMLRSLQTAPAYPHDEVEELSIRQELQSLLEWGRTLATGDAHGLDLDNFRARYEAVAMAFYRLWNERDPDHVI